LWQTVRCNNATLVVRDMDLKAEDYKRLFIRLFLRWCQVWQIL